MRRYTHNLSHTHLLTNDMGILAPICNVEVLPGDTFQHSASALIRVAPLVQPMMHRVQARIHHFYVPNRIIWDDWEDFITGADGAATMPLVTVDTATKGAFVDHFGIPPELGKQHMALPFRAYNLIYNEFYRDQDLTTEVGLDELQLRRVSWEKDYFTTARAVAQQGSTVTIGIQGEAPIVGLGTGSTVSYSSGVGVRETGGVDRTITADGTNSTTFFLEEDAANPGYPNTRADLAAGSVGIDIQEMRQSIALQRIAEMRARYGDRYVDFLRLHGVNPSDGRLNRPELLGGGREDLSFSEVLTTSEGATTVPGDLYGHGIGGMRTNRYRKMFEEHGWVISLLSIRPRTMYSNNLPRKFMRREVTDYWHKELELLPWQEVTTEEVYLPSGDSTVFGYVPQYDEYRQELSYISGDFRNSGSESWHMARDFSSTPTLNGSFVECDPTDRIYSDATTPELYISVANNIIARRVVSREAAI